MKLASKIPLLGLGVVLSLSMAACGGSAQGTSVVTATAEVKTDDGLVINGENIADKATYDKAKTQTLSLYSGYTESSESALVAAFTKDTGIKVNVVRLTPNKLAERVQSEQGAGKLGADVIRTSDYRIAKTLEDAKVWKAYDVPGAAQFKDVSIDGGQFTRMFNSVYTLGYNTQLVKEADAPKSWADAVGGKVAGQAGHRPGRLRRQHRLLEPVHGNEDGLGLLRQVRGAEAHHLRLPWRRGHRAGPRRGGGGNRDHQRHQHLRRAGQGPGEVHRPGRGTRGLRLLPGHGGFGHER